MLMELLPGEETWRQGFGHAWSPWCVASSPRTCNGVAHKLSNLSLLNKCSTVWVGSSPDVVIELLISELAI
jgi:hypothetical protein